MSLTLYKYNILESKWRFSTGQVSSEKRSNTGQILIKSVATLKATQRPGFIKFQCGLTLSPPCTPSRSLAICLGAQRNTLVGHRSFAILFSLFISERRLPVHSSCPPLPPPSCGPIRYCARLGPALRTRSSILSPPFFFKQLDSYITCSSILQQTLSTPGSTYLKVLKMGALDYSYGIKDVVFGGLIAVSTLLLKL